MQVTSFKRIRDFSQDATRTHFSIQLFLSAWDPHSWIRYGLIFTLPESEFTGLLQGSHEAAGLPDICGLHRRFCLANFCRCGHCQLHIRLDYPPFSSKWVV
ncbi:hypothetical protein NPIL_44381 [Nephila pilipes]|uniref:Uncharacterized protein n=1 Tax=Nephila pilipes TaxID=299642 RepID=A0A8X6MHD7_NEPPI|nr:hypothetical protein NPIL_44381 [Nephila pilipes]